LFCENSHPIVTDLEAGARPEGVLAPDGVSDVVLTDRQTITDFA
jgi:hypothetical protein